MIGGDTTNAAVQTSTATVIGIYFNQAYMEMLPWIIAAIPLIIGDLYFGVRKTIVHKEKVQILKAVSMTIDKTFGYICWILIATTLSIAFGVDIIKFTIMGFVYLKEVVSCFRNYANSKGYDVNEIELFKLFWRTAVKKGDETVDSLDKIVREERNGKN